MLASRRNLYSSDLITLRSFHAVIGTPIRTSRIVVNFDTAPIDHIVIIKVMISIRKCEFYPLPLEIGLFKEAEIIVIRIFSALSVGIDIDISNQRPIVIEVPGAGFPVTRVPYSDSQTEAFQLQAKSKCGSRREPRAYVVSVTNNFTILVKAKLPPFEL